MDQFLKLVLLSVTLFNDMNESETSVWPNWLNSFVRNLNKDDHYVGTTLHRYLWHGQVYFQLDIPSTECIYCQIISYHGEFLQWPDYHYDRFFEERTHEQLIWEYQTEVSKAI